MRHYRGQSSSAMRALHEPAPEVRRFAVHRTKREDGSDEHGRRRSEGLSKRSGAAIGGSADGAASYEGTPPASESFVAPAPSGDPSFVDTITRRTRGESFDVDTEQYRTQPEVALRRTEPAPEGATSELSLAR